MEEKMTRSYRLAEKFSQLFDLESKIDTVLSASLYYLNQFMDSERSSIFIFQPWNQKLTIFSSLDLEKHEVSIPKSCGVAGRVFVDRQPAVVNHAYADNRFYREVDEMTGFKTRNLVCTPLLDPRDHCLGTLQSLNKNGGDFSADDLELLNLAARMMAVAINNSRQYNELVVTNEARRKLLRKLTESSSNIFDKA
ncbi:GAF domain-containing protein [Desulfosarcina alkanivorans]|nr:GAF domain-containing protein [Desulfosarcina alkanivorans]